MSATGRTPDSPGALNRPHPMIDSAAGRGPLALSFAQEAMWFLGQLDQAASAAHHLRAAVRLQGKIVRDALRRTLDAIVARHEVLRTHFVVQGGQPMQQIAAAGVGFALLEHDLCGLSAAAQEARVDELSRIEATLPFDLVSGPLIRGRLLCLAAEDHVLLVTQHHIISDVRSTELLLWEISTLYSALSQGQPNPLPPLELQYADYAAWQRQWLGAEILQGQADFWKAQLAGAPALLELPTDRPRPAVQSYMGNSVGLTLPENLTAGLRRLGERHGSTLFMTLLAGWSVLLARLSGQRDIVIGTPVANRTRGETERLIGCFVNEVALRVRLEQDPTVAALLAQIERSTLQAFAHQDIPFAQVVKAVQPPRSLSHDPIFQVMLALDHAPPERELSLPGLKVVMLEQAQTAAQFDLTLSLRDTGKCIAGSLGYAVDLFERATIERMTGHLIRVFEAMVSDDQQRVSALNLLSEPERQQLLVGFNDTRTRAPADRCLPELFEEQAGRTPDALAVVCEERCLSYAELNAHANRLAHHLIALGIRPDDRVAICMQRSPELVVGLLGIVKAGGAYVPLDPDYPPKRLAFMLEDSAPVAVLTHAAARGGLPALKAPVVELDLGDTASNLAREPDHNPDARALGLTYRNLAYVIYTSGSTGLPKGVMVEHRSLVNLIHWHCAAFELGEAQRSSCLAGFGFDAAIWELWPPLCVGAVLLLPPARFMGQPSALLAWWAEQELDVSFLPTPLAEFAFTHGITNAGLRILLVGGDRLRYRSPEAGASSLINNYGPTETTVVATSGRLQKTDAVLHIGRPIGNVQIYILDPHGEPVPIGVKGEIHIAGLGVGRGYLNRADLTAERFLADPFSASADARMYKSGDLGRWLPDGNIEYLGRSDYQVKVRGFRIEPGEIEAQLMRHPLIAEAVVLAREDEPGDKRLVAYYTAAQQPGEPGEKAPGAVQLRAHLLSGVPEYMVPAAFMRLETLPLTPNGKLDIQALPAPDQSSVVSAEYEAPEGAVEAGIARIWQRLLSVQRIGRHDNFFELGGNSLLFLRSMAAIEAEFGRPIAMARAFRAPTPAQFATLIGEIRLDRIWKQLIPLNHVVTPASGTLNPLFCLNGHTGDVDQYLHFARFMHPSVPVYGLRVCADERRADFRELIASRMESYQREIRSIQPTGPYRLCGYSFAGAEAFDLACRLEAAGEEVLLILLDAYRPSTLLDAFTSIFYNAMVFSQLAKSHELHRGFARKIRKLFTPEAYRWLRGKDWDLEHALLRDAKNRKHTAFHGRVILFKCRKMDPWAFRFHPDGRYGWRKYVKGRFDLIGVEAKHMALMKETHVHSIVNHLNGILCE